MKHRANRAAHAMHEGHAAVGKCHAPLTRRDCHTCPCFLVVRLPEGLFQMPRYQLNTGKRERVRQGRGATGDIRFDAMS